MQIRAEEIFIRVSLHGMAIAVPEFPARAGNRQTREVREARANSSSSACKLKILSFSIQTFKIQTDPDSVLKIRKVKEGPKDNNGNKVIREEGGSRIQSCRSQYQKTRKFRGLKRVFFIKYVFSPQICLFLWN